jgi:phosphogluconate dehydratase
MPELHKLTPLLGVLQDQGFKVALVTDGRMSGASGKVPAAIHVTPESLAGGALGKVRTGDVILVDGERGILDAQVPAEELAAREPAPADLSGYQSGLGRELFEVFRANALGAEQGAMTYVLPGQHATTVPPTQKRLHDHFVFAPESAEVPV